VYSIENQGEEPWGENCNQLNYQGEDHHLPHPNPHPHRYYVVNDEQRVAEIVSQELVTFGRKLAIGDRCSSFLVLVVGCSG